MGSIGIAVKVLQRDLRALGLYDGGIDAIFGPMTREAIRTYQRDKYVTGHASEALCRLIRADAQKNGAEDHVAVPIGLSGIEETFGAIEYEESGGGAVRITNNWERENMALTSLPIVGRLYVHRLIIPIVHGVLDKVKRSPDRDYITTFWCFNPRHKMHDISKGLSTHAWGISFEVNPSTNSYGSEGDMPLGIVDKFKNAGFEWGGDWSTPDPMHLQYAKGY